MYLSTLQIRNFRNYKSEIFKFDSNTNTIIGENDAGKTNALTALRILLDDSYYYSNKILKESDFFNGISKGWQAHWIIISATFEGITNDEFTNEVCASISLNSESETMMEELISNAEKGVGNITLFIRPNKAVRKQLYDLSEENNESKFDEFRDSIRLSDYEFFYTSKSNLNFCSDENYKKLVGEIERNKASNPEEDDEALLGSKIDMSDVFKHISVVYIDALRDVLREMKNNRNPVKRIIETIESNIEPDNIEKLKKIIKQLNDTITDVPEIKKIGDNINQQLNSIIGSVYSPNLLLSSTMSDDMGSLAKHLSMKPEENVDIDLLGLGHLNMIYIALKIVEFEACRSRELVNIMIIEEPEAHIHHHIQKTLFEGLNLKETYTQIIMSTHSVHLAESSEISRMNVLKTFGGKTIVMNPSNELNEFGRKHLESRVDLVDAVERYLDVKRNGLLFSKGVILVEGDAEEIVIPQMIKIIFGLTLDELGIGLVNVGSTSFEYVASLFSDDRIQRKCSIITDLDKQVIPLDSKQYKKTAEDRGGKRQEKLTYLFAKNTWVESFYAQTTFELEFLEINRTKILKYILPTIEGAGFKTKETIQEYQDNLVSENLEERSLGMLKLANRVGKGWFAIELSENLDSSVKIPKYIIEAVAFACQEVVDISIYKKILLYTCSLSEMDEELLSLEEDLKNSNNKNVNNTIVSLLKYFGKENDSVYLISYIEKYVNLLNLEDSMYE